MNKPWPLLGWALVTGTIASIVSTAALAALAKAKGKRAVQPANSTSHCLQGESAGSFDKIDLGTRGQASLLTTHQPCSGRWLLRHGWRLIRLGHQSNYCATPLRCRQLRQSWITEQPQSV